MLSCPTSSQVPWSSLQIEVCKSFKIDWPGVLYPGDGIVNMVTNKGEACKEKMAALEAELTQKVKTFSSSWKLPRKPVASRSLE